MPEIASQKRETLLRVATILAGSVFEKMKIASPRARISLKIFQTENTPFLWAGMSVMYC